MINAYIGLGSNLGHPAQQLAAACQKLDDLPNTRLDACSNYYRTPPLSGMDQPDYVNAVTHLHTELDALTLLNHLQNIENQQGRQRGRTRWLARTLDLDLLLYGDEIIDNQRLRVPHYAIAKRNFVIFPLLEINPDINIPGLGKASQLALNLSTVGLERLSSNT